MNITDPQASTAAPKKDLTSEQREREGKAPSGFDRPALGGLQPMCGGGDVSPYKSGRMKLSGLGFRMLLKVGFLLALFLYAKRHGMF